MSIKTDIDEAIDLIYRHIANDLVRAAMFRALVNLEAKEFAKYAEKAAEINRQTAGE